VRKFHLHAEIYAEITSFIPTCSFTVKSVNERGESDSETGPGGEQDGRKAKPSINTFSDWYSIFEPQWHTLNDVSHVHPSTQVPGANMS